MNKYRKSLIQTTTPQERQSNAYGFVVSKKDGIPLICLHGGSMWLCITCADKAVEKGWAKKV